MNISQSISSKDLGIKVAIAWNKPAEQYELLVLDLCESRVVGFIGVVGTMADAIDMALFELDRMERRAQLAK